MGKIIVDRNQDVSVCHCNIVQLLKLV